MHIYQITEETTFKEALESLSNIVKDKGIEPTTLGDLKENIEYYFKDTGIKFQASRGGSHYGHWWTPSRFSDFKITTKTKRTGKLIEISKLKSTHEVCFVGFDLNYNEHSKKLLNSRIIQHIKKNDSYLFFIVERFFDKLYHTKNVTNEDFNELCDVLQIISTSKTLLEQIKEYYRYATWHDNPVVKMIKDSLETYKTIDEYKKFLNV